VAPGLLGAAFVGEPKKSHLFRLILSGDRNPEGRRSRNAERASTRRTGVAPCRAREKLGRQKRRVTAEIKGQ